MLAWWKLSLILVLKLNFQVVFKALIVSSFCAFDFRFSEKIEFVLSLFQKLIELLIESFLWSLSFPQIISLHRLQRCIFDISCILLLVGNYILNENLLWAFCRIQTSATSLYTWCSDNIRKIIVLNPFLQRNL